LALTAALVTLAGGAAASRALLEPEASRIGRIRDPSWLPDGRLVRLISLGQRLALSDFYWLKCVFYVGEGVLDPYRGWAALYPLAEIVTDLDPRYGYAYQVAGSNLSGLAGRYQESDRLLLKGMRNVPDRWSLPFVYAVNKFLYEGDFAEAARYARRAAEIGRRPHLALLAANLSLVSDEEQEYRLAAEFLRESIAQADSEDLRRQLEERLVKVRTYEVLSRIEKAVRAFRDRHLRLPLGLSELAAEGLIPEIPRDPAGGTIVYDGATGAVRSSVLGARHPLRVTGRPR
jgi:hypothetical protein